MTQKLNIYVDIENLSIEGDEFRYKYTYEDIKFMRDGFAISLEEASRKQSVLQRKLEIENEAIGKLEFNLAAMNNILEEMIAANPSLVEDAVEAEAEAEADPGPEPDPE